MRNSARERILEASIALFRERGYRHTTTKMIADAAKVNEVTVFRHFGTKEGIVQAIIQSRSFIIHEIQYVLEEGSAGDLIKDLSRVAAIQYKYVQEYLKLLITLLQEPSPNNEIPSYVSFLPRSVKESLMAYFQRMQNCGKMRITDNEKAAIMFLTPTFGLAFMKGLLGDSVTRVPPQEHLDMMVQHFVNAVCL